jgi:hypothetical protein
MNKLASPWLLACALSMLAVGCGHAQLKAPNDFVTLDEGEGAFAQRFASAQGVVVGVREIDNPQDASAAFWQDALKTRLVQGQGYALLSERAVKAKSGHRGIELRLGRDQAGQPYLYWIQLYVTKKRLYLIELGGKKERFEAQASALEKALSTLTLS